MASEARTNETADLGTDRHSIVAGPGRSPTLQIGLAGPPASNVRWRMPGGRPETMTVLFTDLVGSTAWRMRVGDALADERTAELERASRQIVATAGGTVVKSVGDGVMATFTSAVAALDAASALQSAARRLTVAGTPDALRVGISSGDLVKEADDWMGAAAIEASRLCAEAAGGSVLVAAATVHLSRGRAGGRLRSVGERLLRGFEEPVEVFELLDDTRPGLASGAARAGGRCPVPRSTTGARSPHVDAGAGRHRRYRNRARRRGARCRQDEAGGSDSGSGQRTRVPGAPRSLQRGSRSAVPTGGRCVRPVGHVVPRGRTRPIARAARWRAHTPLAGARRPWRAPDRLHRPPETRKHSGGDSSRRLRGSSGPWQLISPCSSSSTTSNGPNRRPACCSTTSSVRTFQASRCWRRSAANIDPAEAFGDVGTGRTIHVLELAGLSTDAVAELITARAGAAPPAALADRLHRETDGNPFFLGALLTHLDDVAFVRSETGTWLTSAELDAVGVPHGVRAVIRRRLASLAGPTRRALDVAAVCGLSFDDRTVRTVTGGDVDATVDAFDESARRRPHSGGKPRAVPRSSTPSCATRRSTNCPERRLRGCTGGSPRPSNSGPSTRIRSAPSPITSPQVPTSATR